jgi:hypothetical protein
MGDRPVFTFHDHPGEAEVEAFRRHALAGPALVALADHLDACESCRARVAPVDLPAVQRRFETDLEPLADHVPEDDLHGYVNAALSLSRMAAIDVHLAQCAQCAAEIRDLQELAAGMRRPVRRRLGLSVALAAAAVLALVAGGVHVRRRLETPLVVLEDRGGPTMLERSGTLRAAGGLAQAQRDAVCDALASGALPVPADLRDLAGRPSTLLGPTGESRFDALSPVATVVPDSHPVMRWSAAPGATGYIVTLRDEGSADTFSSPRTDTTTWIVDRALSLGHVYRWQVAAALGDEEIIAPGPSEPAARFRVLDARAAAELRMLPPSHAVRVVLYARAGLLDAAGDELRALARLNPGSPLVARWQRALAQAKTPATR